MPRDTFFAPPPPAQLATTIVGMPTCTKNIIGRHSNEYRHHYNISDDDSGCMLDEYGWVPADVTPNNIHSYSALPENRVQYVNSAGEKWRFRQLTLKQPAHEFNAHQCKVNSETEACELPIFSAMRICQNSGHAQIARQVDSEKFYCHQCKKVISENEVVITVPAHFNPNSGIVSPRWHAHCFICVECRNLLVDLFYFYHNQNVFCARHYAEIIKQRCATCNELSVNEKNIEEEERVWHIHHSSCALPPLPSPPPPPRCPLPRPPTDVISSENVYETVLTTPVKVMPPFLKTFSTSSFIDNEKPLINSPNDVTTIVDCSSSSSSLTHSITSSVHSTHYSLKSFSPSGASASSLQRRRIEMKARRQFENNQRMHLINVHRSTQNCLPKSQKVCNRFVSTEKFENANCYDSIESKSEIKQKVLMDDMAYGIDRLNKVQHTSKRYSSNRKRRINDYKAYTNCRPRHYRRKHLTSDTSESSSMSTADEADDNEDYTSKYFMKLTSVIRTIQSPRKRARSADERVMRRRRLNTRSAQRVAANFSDSPQTLLLQTTDDGKLEIYKSSRLVCRNTQANVHNNLRQCTRPLIDNCELKNVNSLDVARSQNFYSVMPPRSFDRNHSSSYANCSIWCVSTTTTDSSDDELCEKLLENRAVRSCIEFPRRVANTKLNSQRIAVTLPKQISQVSTICTSRSSQDLSACATLPPQNFEAVKFQYGPRSTIERLSKNKSGSNCIVS